MPIKRVWRPRLRHPCRSRRVITHAPRWPARSRRRPSCRARCFRTRSSPSSPTWPAGSSTRCSRTDGDVLAGNSAGPALYLVEHSIDATVLGLSIGRRLVPRGLLARSSAPGCSSRTSASWRCRRSLVHHPGPLAPDEWELMMQHPLLGLEFLRDDTISAPAKSVVRSHHERWNGSGYPERARRRGDLRSSRASPRWPTSSAPSRASASTRMPCRASEGIDLIRDGSGSAFDPAVVEAFLDVAGR